ncbi:MAG: gephyrin-like molybdotransferase Glp [Bacteroidia bacterium]
MISVEEAKKILLENIESIKETKVIATNDALGYSLAKDIYAPLDLPPFNQSNVDGYAVCYNEQENKAWKVITEIKAGDNSTVILKTGEAARIFTGAKVPEGATMVLMQEKVSREKDWITCTENVKEGEHIRKKGAQIKKEQLAIKTETLFTPAVIGFVNSLGINQIEAFKKPEIAVVITGNELESAGNNLTEGKVYESNSVTLTTALKAIGLKPSHTLFVNDNKLDLKNAIVEALPTIDVLLISGGISVGDYDFVKEVVEEIGTTTLFYKVAQKPGKPLYYGKYKNKVIFGLPGNPASTLTCFYEYVFPTLKKLQGRKNVSLQTLNIPTNKTIQKKVGLANFLKASIINSVVEPLDGQESFIIKSLTDANAFIYLPQDKETVNKGENVEVHLFPELY